MEKNEEIKEINEGIKDGLRTWADICLSADVDGWAALLEYDGNSILDAVMILMHVCSNVGINVGIINERNGNDFGERIHQLVMDMTGVDTLEIAKRRTGNEKWN